jgi:hypothetical protein
MGTNRVNVELALDQAIDRRSPVSLYASYPLVLVNVGFLEDALVNNQISDLHQDIAVLPIGHSVLTERHLLEAHYHNLSYVP